MNASDFGRVRQLLKTVLIRSPLHVGESWSDIVDDLGRAGLIVIGFDGHARPATYTESALRLLRASRQRYWLDLDDPKYKDGRLADVLVKLGLIEIRIQPTGEKQIRRVPVPVVPAELLALVPASIDPTWQTIPDSVSVGQLRQMMNLKLIRLDAYSGLQWARL